MEPIKPDVMIRQVKSLASDLRAVNQPFSQQISTILSSSEWESINKVYLIGAGDSYHASFAAEMAYESIAGVACEPMNIQRFLDYGVFGIKHEVPHQTLVVATSVSGATKRVLLAVELAKQCGALTLAITGTPNSAIAQLADRTVSVELSHKERSPGIRTYQASLVAMLLLAIRLGEMQGEFHHDTAEAFRQELVMLADHIETTNKAIEESCYDVAITTNADHPVTLLGSGPSYGTACFSAAKIVEAAGVFAVGQDVEEWWHVERFAYPINMPVFMIAPPGRSHWRANEVASAARSLGRRVIAVIDKDDTAIARHAHVVLPVQGVVREEFSPLLYHLFAHFTASFLAARLGRYLFQTNHA